MLINELPIFNKFKELFYSEGINELYPPQKDSIKSGILEGKNLILSTPTASGKTLIAELAIIKALESGKKSIYIVPLKALAYEKFSEFKKYEKLGFNVRLEVGDPDSSKYHKKIDFDILVATAEKCDSILRSRPEWFQDVKVLVLDEIHLISTARGPVYEILAAKFKKLFPNIQILGLSATIGNPDELAGWLNANLVESEWRPVELKEYCITGKTIGKISRLTSDSISAGGQVLIFVNSRKSAESLAKELSENLKLKLDKKLEELSDEILDSLSSPTEQCKKLASCFKNGIAFHHAGLVNKQRTLIEDSFRNGMIKVIVATPTLAAGVNLPSRLVIVRDLKRYTSNGYHYIPVLEYKQMSGRAGRPKYDSKGESIIIAKAESEKEFIEDKYINGEVEPIYSLLGVEPVLRFHILASIASGFTRTLNSLIEFFGSTFFSHQYGVDEKFHDLIQKIISELREWKFIETHNNFLLATPIGNRISELYIDPLTAHNYIKLLTIAESKNKFTSIGLFEILSEATEIRPLLRVKSSDESNVWEDAFSLEDQLLRDLTGFELDWEFLSRFKTARMFEDWTNEKTEQYILDMYGVAPGQLNQKLEIMKWLSYSASELTKLLKLKNSFNSLKNLEIGIMYGIKPELIPLVQIKGIGRVRARKLYNAGIKTPADIKKASIERISKIIGIKIAEKVKGELG